MTFLEIIQLIQEASAMVQAMEADGSLAKVQAAEAAVKAELANPSVIALIAKLKTLKL